MDAWVVIEDREGRSHQVAAASDCTLMQLIRDAGLPISAVCGGCMSCATCHVYIDPETAWLPPPSPGETALLEATSAYDARRSRLACQIDLGPHASGFSVNLAPEE